MNYALLRPPPLKRNPIGICSKYHISEYSAYGFYHKGKMASDGIEEYIASEEHKLEGFLISHYEDNDGWDN